jgi:uncharacterized paraquat-inducible protein A
MFFGIDPVRHLRGFLKNSSKKWRGCFCCKEAFDHKELQCGRVTLHEPQNRKGSRLINDVYDGLFY